MAGSSSNWALFFLLLNEIKSLIDGHAQGFKRDSQGFKILPHPVPDRVSGKPSRPSQRTPKRVRLNVNFFGQLMRFCRVKASSVPMINFFGHGGFAMTRNPSTDLL
jgi:hypothetical protein